MIDDHPRLAAAHRLLTQAAEIIEREAPVAGTDLGRVSLHIARIDTLSAATRLEAAARHEERGR